jgi:hypothetical protein
MDEQEEALERTALHATQAVMIGLPTVLAGEDFYKQTIVGNAIRKAQKNHRTVSVDTPRQFGGFAD